MKKISVKERLPDIDIYSNKCNPYYLIWTPFGKLLAMYLEDEDENIGWWINYSSKLMCEVYYWLDEKE